MEFIGAAIVSGAALFAVLGKGSVSSALAGLSISYALSVTQSLNWMVRMSGELENALVSVERVREYTNIPKEHTDGASAPSAWPTAGTAASKTQTAAAGAKSSISLMCACLMVRLFATTGALKIRDLRLKYRAGLPDVLKGVSCDIKAGEKVGG